MTDQQALLRGILENPADDAPRLVYADWLEERAGRVQCERCKGQPRKLIQTRPDIYSDCKRCKNSGTVSNCFAERAEFIRVQIELRKLTGALVWSEQYQRWRDPTRREYPAVVGDVAKAEALRRRARELLFEHWAAWTPKLSTGTTIELILSPKWTPTGHPAGEFRRGFIDSITCPGDMLTSVVDSVCPDLVQECNQCGKGYLYLRTDKCFDLTRTECRTCHGQGTVARALTGAEQPVMTVRLTSLPYTWDHEPYYHARQMLDNLWPRRLWSLTFDGTKIPPAKERVTT